MVISKNKIVRFKPILDKVSIKKIWNRYNINLDFGKEWDNFLGICENDKMERIFAVNNFLITEFLITFCGVSFKSLNKLNCFCEKDYGQISIPASVFIKHKLEISKFLVNFI